MHSFEKHPDNTDWNVYIVLNAAHMLKLPRNTLAEKGEQCNKEEQQIRLQHIKGLHLIVTETVDSNDCWILCENYILTALLL